MLEHSHKLLEDIYLTLPPRPNANTALTQTPTSTLRHSTFPRTRSGGTLASSSFSSSPTGSWFISSFTLPKSEAGLSDWDTFLLDSAKRSMVSRGCSNGRTRRRHQHEYYSGCILIFFICSSVVQYTRQRRYFQPLICLVCLCIASTLRMSLSQSSMYTCHH